MRDLELFLLFTGPLDGAGLKYMVTGSVASSVYGEPRLTNGIDIVLELDRARAAEFSALYPMEEFYCPPEEVLAVEAARTRRGRFNLIHHGTGYKADIYPHGEDPLHAWGLSRRRRVELGDEGSLWLAPPEYVIIRKLEFHREGGSAKHLADVRGVLEVSGESIDTASIDDWVERLGLGDQWDGLRP